MSNKVKMAINDYEYITAGRFYCKAQKEIIFDLVASANMLSDDEMNSLYSTLFLSDISGYNSETDCANGLLLMAAINDRSYAKEILSCRKKALGNLISKHLWCDKDTWLKFIFDGCNSFYGRFESAIHYYLVDDIDKAVSVFIDLANNCHKLSVKILIFLFRNLVKLNEEAKYLILLKRITEELYFEFLPTEFEECLAELLHNIPDKVLDEAYDIKLKYFSESSSAISRIGFN